MSSRTDASASGSGAPDERAAYGRAATRIPWRMYLLLATVGSIMIAAVAFGSYKFESTAGTHLPRADACMELRLDLTTAHLWLEEILSGDRHEEIETVWMRLDRADARARSMLDGGTAGLWTFRAAEQPDQRKVLNEIREKIAELRRMAMARFEDPNGSGVGSPADQRFDEAFESVQKLASQFERGAYEEVGRDLKTFGSTQTALMMAVTALLFVAGLAFNRFERRQAATLVAVRSSAASLEREVAERLKVEHSLKRTQYAIDHASDPVYWVMPDASISYANEAACKALGYTHDELTSLRVPDIDPDFTWERWPTHWQKMKNSGSMTIESHHRTKEGKLFPMEITTDYVRNRSEEYIWAYVRDISERKRSEEALRHSEERFRGISSAASDAIVMMDERANISFWNLAAEKMFGYSSDEALGASLHELIVPERYRAAFTKAFPVFLETGQGSVLGKINEMMVMPKEGPEFPAEVAISRVQLWGRWHAAGIVRDVSERRRAERERARLAMAVEQAAEMILVVDPEGVIQYVNPAFERVTGYARDEAIGQTPHLVKSGKHDERFYDEMWKQIRSGKVWTGQMTNRKKDGSFYQEAGTISPIFDDSGAIINFVSVRRDLTRELELESQLRQSQKMEAIGLLAGGVAHDFNNLLATINGYVALANSAVGEDHEAYELLSGIQRALDQGEAVTQSLLTFSCGAPARKKHVDLCEHAKQVVRLLDRVMPDGITVSLESAATSVWINANASQLQQIIMNLAINARDAMPKGGTVSVVVAREPAGSKGQDSSVPMATLTVRDTGVGMTQEVRDRIFEPFFSTKPKGRGTGLGLAIIHGIVKDHGGRVTVRSEPGCGSSFVVAFPLIADELATDESVSHATEPPGPGELVVLADSNPHVRGIMDTALQSLAYEVVQVGDGISLHDCADLQGSRIRLFVIDVDLPRKSALDFLKALRSQGNRTPVVLIADSEVAGDQDGIDENTTIVIKPFAVADFSTLVRGILGQQHYGSGV